MAGNNTIVFTGIEETLAALKEFDKNAVKRFTKVINDELRRGKEDARKIILVAVAEKGAPLSHWQTQAKIAPRTQKQADAGRPWPAWNTDEVISGIVSSKAQGKANMKNGYTTSAGALINNSRAGAIFEIAGRVSGGGTNASGTAFKQTLNNTYGRASRVVWRIVDRDGAMIRAKFGVSLDEAKATLQKELDKRTSI